MLYAAWLHISGSLKHLVCRHPNGVFGMSLDNGLDLIVHLVKAVAFDDGCEIIYEVVFQPHGPVEGLVRLLLCHPIVDGHDEAGVAGLQKDGDGVEAGRLQPLDGVAADVQDAVLALLRNLLDGGHGGAVEIAVVLPGLDEFVVLYVGLHGLAGLDEVVVAAVDLELPSRSGGVGNT